MTTNEKQPAALDNQNPVGSGSQKLFQLLASIEERSNKATPGPWDGKEHSCAGIQIWAPVNLGKDSTGALIQPIYEASIRPQIMVGEDGKAHVMICYEDWRQFPSTDFKQMQKDNVTFIASSRTDQPNLVKFGRRLLEIIDRNDPELLAYHQAELTAILEDRADVGEEEA